LGACPSFFVIADMQAIAVGAELRDSRCRPTAPPP
jgi:hypothetical protein